MTCLLKDAPMIHGWLTASFSKTYRTHLLPMIQDLVFGWNREDKILKKMKGDNTMNTRYFNFDALYRKQRLITYTYMLAYFSLF
jgi:hypothetical protein